MCLNKCSALLLTLLVVSFISKGHGKFRSVFFMKIHHFSTHFHLLRLIFKSHIFFVSFRSANYEFNQVGSKIITSSFAAKRYYDDCVDFSGRSVKHGFHFVPPKQNMCPMCICENGHPKVNFLFVTMA